MSNKDLDYRIHVRTATIEPIMIAMERHYCTIAALLNECIKEFFHSQRLNDLIDYGLGEYERMTVLKS